MQSIRKVSKKRKNICRGLEYVQQLAAKEIKENFKKILVIKIIVEDGVLDTNSTHLSELLSKVKSISIVLLLRAKDYTQFKLFWKSSNIEHFLTLKPFKTNFSVDDNELWKFISKFLTTSLRNGHLGFQADHKIHEKSPDVELHKITDLRGYNLLLIACEHGYGKLIPNLVKCNLSWKLPENKNITAQIIAHEEKHSNVLLKLIKSNLPFPPNLNIKNCSRKMKKFIEMTTEFHKMIKDKNIEKLAKIIIGNPDLRHFYNLSNKSALYIALDNELIDMYEFLVSKNLCFGPDENVDEVFKFLKPINKDRVHKIHLKYTKPMPSNHINIIMSNTTLTHDEIDEEGKRQLVLRAYLMLNKDPFLKVILMAVAAYKDFHIVFDFLKDSTHRFDPWTGESTKGIFYLNGQITIGAQQLLDPETENQVLGTLAHELCHFAVFAAFENNAKPYKSNDLQTEEMLAEIIEICEQKKDEEKYIRLVYDCYSKSQQPAELIVRPAHLIALYHLDAETLKQKREIFIEIFHFFENIVIPAIRAAIPNIEKRLVYKPTYKFSELTDHNKMVVKKGDVLYQNVKVRLSDLYYGKDDVYEILTADHISQLLDKKTLNFDDPHLRYLEEVISFNWESLAGSLKRKIFDTSSTFGSRCIKFSLLSSKYQEALKSLTTQQIKDILSGADISIGKIKSGIKFYTERIFVLEDIKMIAFEYQYGHEYIDNHKYRSKHVANRTKNKTLQEFSDEFSNLDSNERLRTFDKIRQNLFFKTRAFNLNSENFKRMHKNSSEIIEQAEIMRILILSSEAGSGKTVSFEHLAIKIKDKYPLKWVSYIDLKDHIKFFKILEICSNVQELLEKIFNLSSTNEFERKIFEEAFRSGDAVLLWNGFDEISPTYNEFVLNLIKNIHENTKNIQFVCTRPLYSEQLSKAFSTRPWQLVPFDDDAKREFLKQLFIFQNVSKDKLDENVKKIEEIIEDFQFKNKLAYNFDSPLMLVLIEKIANINKNKHLTESKNLYEIFDKFIDCKIKIWLDRSENSPNKIRNVRNFGIFEKIYHKYAMLDHLYLFPNTLRLKLKKLQIMHTEIPKDLSFEEISSMGILYITATNEFEFVHKTFSDFFVAKYFIENVYNADDIIDSNEALLRLELFFILAQSYGNKQNTITNFMSSYLEHNICENEKFCKKISKLFRTKFRSFFFRMLDTNYPEIFKFLFNFFKKDHQLLVELLHVNEPETLYTAIFNPNYFGLFIDPEEIKYLAQNCLTKEEFESFINGLHQKGKIMSGMHFYGLLGVSKKNDFYETELKATNGMPFWESFDKYFKQPKFMGFILNFFYSSSIEQVLTENEQKELFIASMSPKIYLFYDRIFIGSDFSEYEKMWTRHEKLLSQKEMQDALGDAIIQYFEINPSDKTSHELYLKLLLKKVEKFLSNSQIYKMFLTKNILHEAHWDPDSFKILWDFLSQRTNSVERGQILLQTGYDDKNFYFHTHFDDMKKVYSSYNYPYFYYDFTPFNVFHRSMILSGISPSFKFTIQIYEENFNKSEIQDVILCSNDFLLYSLDRSFEESFKKLISYFEQLFEGHENLLLEMLNRKINRTNSSVSEFVDNFRGLSYSQQHWFCNLEILNDLYFKVNRSNQE